MRNYLLPLQDPRDDYGDWTVTLSANSGSLSNVEVVPEPGTALLFLTAAAAAGATRLRRRPMQPSV